MSATLGAPIVPPGSAFGWLAAFTIAAGVLVRLHGIEAPPFDYHATRQYDTAAIARNFAEGAMNPLYPQIDWRGDSPGYVESEFPAYTYLVALLYRLLGVHEWLGRALNIAFYVLSAAVLFRWAVRLVGHGPAVLAVFFYTVMPLSVFFNRTFQTDTLLCLASLVGVYGFERWTDTGRMRALAISAIGVALALLIKPFTAYLALPLGYLAYRRFGRRVVAQRTLWLYGAATLAPALIWYRHAYHLWETYGNTLFRGYAHLSLPVPSDPFWPELLRVLLERLVFLVATPAGLAFLVVGAFASAPKGNRVLHYWMLGFGVSVFLANEPHYDHEYYQLPAVFAAALFMAHGASILLDRGILSRGAIAALGLAVAPLGVLRVAPFFFIPAEEYAYVEYGRRVAERTEPDALLIVIQGGPDPRRGEWFQHRIAPGEYVLYYPADLYLSHRKGWSVGNDQISPALVERLRRRGARYVVTFHPFLLDETPGLRGWLDGHHVRVDETSRWSIYRLADREATPPQAE